MRSLLNVTISWCATHLLCASLSIAVATGVLGPGRRIVSSPVTLAELGGFLVAATFPALFAAVVVALIQCKRGANWLLVSGGVVIGISLLYADAIAWLAS